MGWLVILLIMIKAYRKFSPGASIIDPLGNNSFDLHVVNYVDDNSLLRSFSPQTTLNTIFEILSRELMSWWKLLRVTGGDLALEKCTYSIMRWRWSGFYNTRSMVSADELDGNLTVSPCRVTR